MLKKYINLLGPVSTYINFFADAVRNYESGVIIYECDNSPELATFPVQIIGYGYERGYPYFLIAANLGTEWGIKPDGTIKILADDSNMCGVLNNPIMPLLGVLN